METCSRCRGIRVHDPVETPFTIAWNTQWARNSVREEPGKSVSSSGNRHLFDVRMMCQLPEVTPSGYYAWLKQPQSRRSAENGRLPKLIRASFDASNSIYGSLLRDPITELREETTGSKVENAFPIDRRNARVIRPEDVSLCQSLRFHRSEGAYTTRTAEAVSGARG